MSITERSKPEVQQFKNAYHMGRSKHSKAAVKFEISPQMGKKDSQSHFGISSMGQHFKDIDLSPARSKSSLDGFGITVEDSGHLLIAQWKGNLVDGRYFLFKVNLGQQGQRSNYSALCQYGWMKGGLLSGQSYLYNITGTLARGTFQENRLVGKCHIIHNNKMFLANETTAQERIDCQVIIGNQQSKEEAEQPSTKNQSSNFLKVPKISVSSAKQTKFPSSFEQVQAKLFIRPNQFLQQLIATYKSIDQNGDSLVYNRVSERQYFLGFIQTAKKTVIQQKDELKVTGFGVILKNEWPISYGTFKQGKLSGLGRVYENEMNLFDGYFLNGQLMQGFIVDYMAQTTSFGHKSSIDPELHSSISQSDCFVITNTFPTLSSEYLAQYRKNFHLRSLNFNNGYFCSPKLIHRSPWPYNILDRLTRRTQMQSIIRSFRPTFRDMEISQIQKVGHSSENRVQKMLVQQIRESGQNSKERQEQSRQQLMRQKSNFIKNQIQKNLKEKEERREEDSKEKMISGYVNQYKRIQRRKTEIIAANRSKSKSYSKREDSLQQNSQPSFDLRQALASTQRQQREKVEKKLSRLQSSRQSQYQQHLYTPKSGLISQRSQQKPKIQPLQLPPQPEPLPKASLTPKKSTKTPKNIKEEDPMTPPKESQLTLLVHQYQQCQTQRKNSISMGNQTRRSNTESKQTPRQLHSKYDLMQQDYQHFLGLEKGKSSARCYHPRVRVDLDLIYREHLRK